MGAVSGITLISKSIESITETSGIYKMIDVDDNVIYVGKAKNLLKRVQQYTQIKRLPNRLRLMVSLIAKIEVLVTKSEEEALLLEAQLIKGLQPRFNIALKDNKSFAYIAIDHSHAFPRIFKYRGNKKDNISYFGPFSSVADLENILLNVQKIFKLRSCSDSYFSRRQRPCLLYQISKCSAPCVQKINEDDYKKNLKNTKKFLAGDVIPIRNELIKQMEIASNALNFEKAASIRDTIQLLNHLKTEGLYSEIDYENIDIFAIYTDQFMHSIQIFSIREVHNVTHESFFLEAISGDDELIKSLLLNYYNQKAVPMNIAINCADNETIKLLEKMLKTSILNVASNKSIYALYNIAKKNAELFLQKCMKDQMISDEILERLKEILGLERDIKRIEVYDNSHIQGQYAVGCMIVNDGQKFIKDEYRIFKIKNDDAPIVGDDYLMMREMLVRRLKKLNNENFPDLILIDGGANHLSVAHSVLQELSIDKINVVAIAKGPKRNAGKETFYLSDKKVLNFSQNDKLLHYLQRLRDEAHRFAISTHRKLRKKETIISLISTVPGIGIKRQKTLLSIFGSYEKIKQASLEELQNAPNFGKKFALRIYNYLHNSKDA